MSEYVRRTKHLDRLVASRLGELDIELTERCDNNCVHCFINLPAGDAVARSREMDTSRVCAILRQAADLGCLQVRFTGGEPLLRPDFEELYRFARGLGLKVLIFTNGRGVTEHLADVLVSVPPLAPVEVTVYGMHEHSYEEVSRAPGSFLQFWRGIGLLLERNIPLVVKGVYLPSNRHEIEEFEAWASSIPGMGQPVSYSAFFDLRGRRDDPAKNRLIKSLRPSLQDGLSLLTRREASYREEMTAFADRYMGQTGDALFPCGLGHGMSVDAYGWAHPCLGLRTPELAVDTDSHSLADALDSFEALKCRRTIAPEYLRRCAACFLHGLCEQCPAKSWMEHGVLDRPVEYLCQVAHAQARFLGWLREDEHGWEVADWRSRIRS